MTAFTLEKDGAYVLGVGNACVILQTEDRRDNTAMLINLILIFLFIPNNPKFSV